MGITSFEKTGMDISIVAGFKLKTTITKRANKSVSLGIPDGVLGMR
jgi:hypothetical protein